MNWFVKLDDEDREFVKQLTISSGSLKTLAKIYQVSYPTVRTRLDRIIQKIELTQTNTHTSFENNIMQLVIEEKISLDIAKK
ncbi:DUF2089 family protein [Leuconostoc gelidum]|uniref:DUF2089 family protein n=1 Tax=Leuconostoc gelidum TaxID=1244 RepID=UPI001C7CF53A|nr:DUF2089 family protein [Leuconostoc gelidum]MBZ6010043.1 DUF2089 family protein [Leuconostoc gelidum subsp. aenigmaticum]